MCANEFHPSTPAGGGAEAHDRLHRQGIPHVHTNKKAVMNRLARLIGHLESVRRMVERDEDCSQVLIQLAAVRSALNNTGKVILQEHISECIVSAVEQEDFQKIEELNRAIEQFVK